MHEIPYPTKLFRTQALANTAMNVIFAMANPEGVRRDEALLYEAAAFRSGYFPAAREAWARLLNDSQVSAEGTGLVAIFIEVFRDRVPRELWREASDLIEEVGRHVIFFEEEKPVLADDAKRVYQRLLRFSGWFC